MTIFFKKNSFGTNVVNDCGLCVNSHSTNYESIGKDVCGVCGGNGTSCLGCNGVPNSNLIVDNCGVCGGNNVECFVIVEIIPSAAPNQPTFVTGQFFFNIIFIIFEFFKKNNFYFLLQTSHGCGLQQLHQQQRHWPVLPPRNKRGPDQRVRDSAVELDADVHDPGHPWHRL